MEIMLLGIVLVFAAFFAIGMLVAMTIAAKLVILATIMVVFYKIARKVGHVTMDRIIPALENLVVASWRAVFAFGPVLLLLVVLRTYRQADQNRVATIAQASFEMSQPPIPLEESIAGIVEGDKKRVSRIIAEKNDSFSEKLKAADAKLAAANEKIKSALNGVTVEAPGQVTISISRDDASQDKKVDVIAGTPKPEPKPIRFESGPCATPEKARTELESKIVEYIAEEQTQSGQAISISPKKVLAGMKINPKMTVEEKVVGDEKYTLFRASLELTPDTNLIRRILVLENQNVARDRFEVLLGCSVCIAVFLGLWSRLV